jgi:hypothetical protein
VIYAEYGNTEGSPNPNGSKLNQPLQLPLQQTPLRAPKLTNFKSTGTTRNKAIAKELTNRIAYQIQYVNARAYLYSQETFFSASGTHSCYRLSKFQGPSEKNSKNLIGTQTRDFPAFNRSEYLDNVGSLSSHKPMGLHGLLGISLPT